MRCRDGGRGDVRGDNVDENGAGDVVRVNGMVGGCNVLLGRRMTRGGICRRVCVWPCDEIFGMCRRRQR